jgi:hypothetical protein
MALLISKLNQTCEAGIYANLSMQYVVISGYMAY